MMPTQSQAFSSSSLPLPPPPTIPSQQADTPRAAGGQGRARQRGRQNRNSQRTSSCPWINSQIVAASDTGGFHHLVHTITTHLPHMNLVNLSTSLHRIAKLAASDSEAQAEVRQHPALRDLLDKTALAFDGLEAMEVQPQSLSNVVWSLATMRLMHRPLVQAVATLAVAEISGFKPFELSTMLWAFAKLGSGSGLPCTKPVFQASAVHVVRHAAHFGFRCLATTAWAFATARQRHARLFRTIAAQMMPMVHVANSQEMANTAWAFGTADFHDHLLFAELAEKALLRLHAFKPQELSNMLWGFATNGFFHEAFFTQATIAAQRMDLQAQHLANILWAYSRVRPRLAVTHTTILALLPSCTRQIDTFKPQEVSSTALAVAKAFGSDGAAQALPKPVVNFFAAVFPWALPRLADFSAQSLANTVSAFAMLRLGGCDGEGSGLLVAIGHEVLGRAEGLEATALVHLMKVFAASPPTIGSGVVRALAAVAARRVEGMRPQELQTLSRICVASLGMRQQADLTCEELRQCCAALASGQATMVQESQGQSGLGLPHLLENAGDAFSPGGHVPSSPSSYFEGQLGLSGGESPGPRHWQDSGSGVPQLQQQHQHQQHQQSHHHQQHQQQFVAIGYPSSPQHGRDAPGRGMMPALSEAASPPAWQPEPEKNQRRQKDRRIENRRADPRGSANPARVTAPPEKALPTPSAWLEAEPKTPAGPTVVAPAGQAEQHARRAQAKAVAATVSNQGRNFRLSSVQELEVMHAHNQDYAFVQEQVSAWEQWQSGAQALSNPPSLATSGPLSAAHISVLSQFQACAASEIFDEEPLDMLHLPPHIPAFCNEAFREGLESIPIHGAQGMTLTPDFTMAASLPEYFQAVYEPSLQPEPTASPRRGWRCSVKNSFLHVEHGRNSEQSSTTYQSNPDNDVEDSYDGSSQRSSSVPSRFDHETFAEDRDQLLVNLDRETRDSLALMDFDWGLPMSSKRSWLPTSTADDGGGIIDAVDPTILVAPVLPPCVAPIMRLSA